MQSSRDSSVWRSLAVAFGDGLAFGVGMKLTQPAGRTPVAAPQTDLSPLALRLEEMEQRIAEIENRPAALPPAERAAVSSQPFDQKVLEAVVNALEARLREHASQVERQLTDLQAKVTIELNTLNQQDHSVAEGMQSRMKALQEHLGAELAALNKAADADRKNIESRLGAIHHDVAEVLAEQLDAIRANAEADRQNAETRIDNLHHDIADVLSEQLETVQQQLREEVRRSLANVTSMAATAADSAAENRLAPMRAALEAKDREIAELRARLADNDRASLDLLQGVGEICRRAAERYAAPPTAPPAPEEAVEAAPAIEPPPADDVPGFAQPQTPGRLWRVPLVSSLVLTSGVMLMMHYL
ncbi:MAG TPA: hypothetical protein VG456_28390 [Candidatus Sulfopaludibacter sp.]|jgi:hypothetical protein|nr:hypothetical protein [Candidatus Sulfopaludibacter sp.]